MRALIRDPLNSEGHHSTFHGVRELPIHRVRVITECM